MYPGYGYAQGLQPPAEQKPTELWGAELEQEHLNMLNMPDYSP